jgi:acetyl-CoA C-acetyltransferase
MLQGFKDRVVIAGVGYTKFGELWDKSPEDLLVDAVYEALDDAGVGAKEIQAGWCGIQYEFTGVSGGTPAEFLKMYGIPFTRVENFCASGMDAFRNACLAVASGVYDLVLACGVEKLSDQGSRGLPGLGGARGVSLETPPAPCMFALAATRCFEVNKWTKETLANVAVKNHEHGSHHPKAHFRKAIKKEDALKAPIIAWPLGVFDCCAMSDGSAALIITTPERAKSLKHKSDHVKVLANAISVNTMYPWFHPQYQFTGFPSTQQAGQRAYEMAGIKNPAEELDLVECHDCFTITELLNIEDLGLCGRGQAGKFVEEGHCSYGGKIPVNVSGGLKCFGHPIGATGCRMLVEITKQLQGRADGLQVKDAKRGLAHNLGGAFTVAAVTILGRNDT